MSTLTADTLQEPEVLCGKVFDFTEAAIRLQPLREAALHAAALARRAGRTICYAINYRPDSWSEPLGAMRTVQKQAIAAADHLLGRGALGAVVSSGPSVPGRRPL